MCSDTLSPAETTAGGAGCSTSASAARLLRPPTPRPPPTLLWPSPPGRSPDPSATRLQLSQRHHQSSARGEPAMPSRLGVPEEEEDSLLSRPSNSGARGGSGSRASAAEPRRCHGRGWGGAGNQRGEGGSSAGGVGGGGERGRRLSTCLRYLPAGRGQKLARAPRAAEERARAAPAAAPTGSFAPASSGAGAALG